jgi:probable F420-dependent oxidoreductase
MKYGASLPVGDWGDIIALRDCAQMLDESGMDYVSLATHILGMPMGSMPDEPLHHYYGPFREPCVLFAYLAGQTRNIRFRPAVLILPLYPTALLAKQLADVSIMSGGRLELGVGISWNPREYEALGQDFHTRGTRLEEQITLLRRLWTEPYVSFEGRWHRLDEIGLNQLPPPIPILMGAGTDEARLRRVARLGDGWIPLADPVEPLTRLRRYLEEEGRDPATFQVSGRLPLGQGGPKDWIERVWRLHEAGIRDMEIFPGRGVSGAEAATAMLDARKLLLEEFG